MTNFTDMTADIAAEQWHIFLRGKRIQDALYYISLWYSTLMILEKWTLHASHSNLPEHTLADPAHWVGSHNDWLCQTVHLYREHHEKTCGLKYHKMFDQNEERTYLSLLFIHHISKAHSLTYWQQKTACALTLVISLKYQTQCSDLVEWPVMYENSSAVMCGYPPLCLVPQIASRQTSRRWKTTWLMKVVPTLSETLLLARVLNFSFTPLSLSITVKRMRAAPQQKRRTEYDVMEYHNTYAGFLHFPGPLSVLYQEANTGVGLGESISHSAETLLESAPTHTITKV